MSWGCNIYFCQKFLRGQFLEKKLPTATALSLPSTIFLPSAPAQKCCPISPLRKKIQKLSFNEAFIHSRLRNQNLIITIYFLHPDDPLGQMISIFFSNSPLGMGCHNGFLRRIYPAAKMLLILHLMRLFSIFESFLCWPLTKIWNLSQFCPYLAFYNSWDDRFFIIT